MVVGQGGGGAMVLKPTKKKSVLTELQTKCGEFEKGFQGWVSEQPWPVETAVVTATQALQGAAYGVLIGSFLRNFNTFQEISNVRFLVARQFAVWKGTSEGMICAMKRIRGGEDDTKSRMVAGFTSGYMMDKVANVASNNAIVTGLVFALCYGLVHKVYPSQSTVLDDTCYTRTRSMLANLGLQKYEKHFKKHLITDNTIPWLQQSDLVEAKIPLGPRVLILNHIRSDPDLQKMRGS